jgi:hypothetical protein
MYLLYKNIGLIQNGWKYFLMEYKSKERNAMEIFHQEKLKLLAWTILDVAD